MSSRIEQLIGDIENYIDECKYQTLSNTKILVNKDEIMELLVELRMRIPDEIKQYQKIISNRDAILEDARSQADVLIAQATAQADALMAQATSQADALMTQATTQADEMMTQATAQTNELINEHEIMQRAYAEANRVVEMAQQQAQDIVNSAYEDANSIRLGSINYTDDMLRSLQAIITHSMESAQGKFDSYMSSMQSTYDVVTANRSELSAGVSTAQEEAPEES